MAIPTPRQQTLALGRTQTLWRMERLLRFQTDEKSVEVQDRALQTAAAAALTVCQFSGHVQPAHSVGPFSSLTDDDVELLLM